MVLKHVKHKLYFAVEKVNHLNSLLQLDEKYGVYLHALKYTIGKLSLSLVMVKAKVLENVKAAIEKKDIQKLARRRKERMAAAKEKMERTVFATGQPVRPEGRTRTDYES